VLGPRLQVPTRDADIDAREADGALHPGRVDRVAHRDLAQLHEPTILDAGLVDADERARGDELVPVLADRDRGAGTRAGHRTIPPAALAERLQVSGARGRRAPGACCTLLRVEVRPVAPQSALGAVPDLPTVPDIQQTRDLHFPEPERRAHAAGPIVVRVLHDAQVGVLHRHAVG